MMTGKKEVRYMASPLLSGKPVVHGFLTRQGGVSDGAYESLNFDARGEDALGNVERNLELFRGAFGVAKGRLVTVSQVHGKEVLAVEGEPPARPVEADAIVTNQKGVALGIMTADCQPILFFDPANNAVGAAHAGWKGTALGIAAATLEEMGRRFGTKPGDVIASLGPCIGPCCYQVGWNVLDEYMARHRDADCFKERGGLRMDINAANFAQLLSAGVSGENISDESACTSCNPELFFSHRRDSGRTGRHLSFIMLDGGDRP